MKSTNALPAIRVAAPVGPCVVLGVPRAASAEGHQISVAAEPDVGKASSRMEIKQHVQTYIFKFFPTMMTHLIHSCFYERFI